jgi:anti-sigma-K factor RskA
VNPADHPLDELAVYALDALDDDERRAVEAHLATCPACAAELDAHRAALAALTLDEPPPPVVWSRIASEIGATGLPTPLPARGGPGERPAAPTMAGPPPETDGGGWRRPADAAGPGRGPVAPTPITDRPTHLRRSDPGRTRRFVLAGLGVAAALVLVVGLVGLLRPDQTSDLNDLAAAALRDADGNVAQLSGDAGEAARVVVDDGTAFVFVDDLPTLPEGQEYQVWKVGGPAPVSLGMVGDGSAPVAALGAPADLVDVAISVEPAGGSVAPSEVVATGSFS